MENVVENSGIGTVIIEGKSIFAPRNSTTVFRVSAILLFFLDIFEYPTAGFYNFFFVVGGFVDSFLLIAHSFETYV